LFNNLVTFRRTLAKLKQNLMQTRCSFTSTISTKKKISQNGTNTTL
jgi:hypothetical protein